jgi:cytochrome c nitrite reductase small subunit
METSVKKIARLLFVILPVLLVLGLTYFFLFQNGASYFTNKPEACINCHVMQPSYDDWTRSSHHQTAVCNDCHLSQTTVAKTIEKIQNGVNHSIALVLRDGQSRIVIKTKSKKILQTNCARCHNTTIKTDENHVGMDEATSCLTCHAQTGHQKEE